MDANFPENPSAKEPMPDIKNTEPLSIWMKENIIRPPRGYDAMKHQDGTPFNKGEQIDAYITQTVDVIEFLKEQNRPTTDYEEIKQAILGLTQPENPILKHT